MCDTGTGQTCPAQTHVHALPPDQQYRPSHIKTGDNDLNAQMGFCVRIPLSLPREIFIPLNLSTLFNQDTCDSGAYLTGAKIKR